TSTAVTSSRSPAVPPHLRRRNSTAVRSFPPSRRTEPNPTSGVASRIAPERRTMADFDLRLPFALSGDQPQAIEELTAGFRRGEKYQTLLGVTGSGKTVTMASVIANLGKPT